MVYNVWCASLSRSPIIPGDGEGFKLSTLTTDELCDALVPKVLGVTFEYAGCAWVSQGYFA